MAHADFNLDISGFTQLITEKAKKHGGIPKLCSFQIFSPLCVIGVVWAIQLLECYTAVIVQNIHCVVSQKLLLGAVGYELTR